MTNLEYLNSLAAGQVEYDTPCDHCAFERENCGGRCLDGWEAWLGKEHEEDKP